MKNKFFVFISLLLSLIVFAGCGYKPTTSIAKHTIGGKVFIDVKIDVQNLNNSILIKDALINIIASKLDVEIVKDKNLATTSIYGELKSVSEIAMDTDLAGYTKVYRENVIVYISYVGIDKKVRDFTVSNYYDFVVSDDSVVTQSKKEEAIKLAINKALSDVFSKIAIHSL
ncbi:MAG: hypothetical protein PHF17_09860 [Arcobacteraceae bacterium]|nr:hypothetical protein [Arcobacteraceae bacterium]